MLELEKKVFLLLYLCKVLSVEHKVVLVSDYPFFLEELDIVNYSDNFVIERKGHEDRGGKCDFLVMDICDETSKGEDIQEETNEEIKEKVEMDATYLVVSPFKNEVVYAQSILESLEKKFTIVFQNLLYDSKITPKYLMKRFGLTRKKPSDL